MANGHEGRIDFEDLPFERRIAVFKRGRVIRCAAAA